MNKSNPLSVNLVLSGGGARIAYQLGVVEKLMAENVKFESVLGTSSGALIGVMLAQNKFEELKKIVLSLNILFLLFRRLMIKYFLKKYVKLEDVCMPFTFTVTSLLNSEAYYLDASMFTSNKEFRKALFAACDFPTLWTLPTKRVKLKDYTLYQLADAGAKVPIPISDKENSLLIACTPKYTTLYLSRNSILDFIHYIGIAFNQLNKYTIEYYNNVIQPENKLNSATNFTNNSIKQMYEHGRR